MDSLLGCALFPWFWEGLLKQPCPMGAYLSVVQLINTSLTNIFSFVSGVLNTWYFLLPLHFQRLFFLLPQEPSLLIEVPSFFFYYPQEPSLLIEGGFPGSRLSVTPKMALFKYFSPCFRRKPRNWKFFLCLKQNGFLFLISWHQHVFVSGELLG